MNVHQMQVNLLILGLFLAVVPHISRGFIFESRNMYAFFKGYFGAMGAIVGVPSGWLLAQDLAKEQLLAGSMFFIGVYFFAAIGFAQAYNAYAAYLAWKRTQLVKVKNS